MRYIKSLRALAVICVCNTNPAVAAEWSGFYAGININSTTVESDWSTTETRDPNGDMIPATSDPEASLESTETGGGFIIGYNWNTGSGWVFGVEASTGSNDHEDSIDDRIPGLGDSSSMPTSFVDVRSETDGMALRLRGGYLLTPDLFLYGTFGKTHLDVEITSTCLSDPNVCAGDEAYINTGDLNANAIGVGMEYAIDDFVVRIQYSDADFDGPDFTALPDVENFSFGADAKVEFSAAFVQLGVTHEF